jgi:hypothetical protein
VPGLNIEAFKFQIKICHGGFKNIKTFHFVSGCLVLMLLCF